MLPNNYELTRDNTNTNELKAYRVLQIVNIILKLLSVSLISLPVLFSDYYWFLVVGVFVISMIVSFIAGNIAKYYKYNFYNNIIEISKIGFNQNEKILFKDNVSNCKFTKKYTSNTIVTTKEPFGAIITNNNDYILIKPDQYLIGLLENGMRKNKWFILIMEQQQKPMQVALI